MTLLKTRLLRLLLILVLAAPLGACSSGFDAKWQAAAGRRPADPYSGRWMGEWKSTRRSHGDRLECILTKLTVPSEQMRRSMVQTIGAAGFPPENIKLRWSSHSANFHAHWHGLSSSYTMPLFTTPTREGLRIQGEHDLGWLQGGVYKYDGLITPTTFRLNYDSRYDTGIFELHRAPPGR